MSNDSRVISIRNLVMDVAQTIRNAPDLDTGFRQLCQFLDNRDQAAQSRHAEEREALTDAIQDVIFERKRQDEKWGGAEHDDQHSVSVFVQLIQDYAGWARVMEGMNSTDKARNRLIQVAAIAVAAVESIDRKAIAILDSGSQGLTDNQLAAVEFYRSNPRAAEHDLQTRLRNGVANQQATEDSGSQG